jgi:hypothetical protein
VLVEFGEELFDFCFGRSDSGKRRRVQKDGLKIVFGRRFKVDLGVNYIKLFSSSLTARQKGLECSSLTNLSGYMNICEKLVCVVYYTNETQASRSQGNEISFANRIPSLFLPLPEKKKVTSID